MKLKVKDVPTMSTKEFLKKFDADQCFNFYDWFCTDNALKLKGKSLYAKLKKFLNKNTRFNLNEDNNIAFVNCLTCDLHYYDCIVIANESDKDDYIEIVPKTVDGECRLKMGFENEPKTFPHFRSLLQYISS